MAFQIDDKGNISLIQGDSGTIVVEGINTARNYTVYFGVRDKNRNPVGNEIFVNSNYSSTVVFQLTGSFTDLLSVNKNENYATYYYGIKLCDSENALEDTLILDNDEIGGINTITVYPKKVEGTNG